MPAVLHVPVSSSSSAFRAPQIRQRTSDDNARRRLPFGVSERSAIEIANPNPNVAANTSYHQHTTRTDDATDELAGDAVVASDDVEPTATATAVTDSISAYIALRKSYARTAKEERRMIAMQRRRKQINREYLSPPTLSAPRSARLQRFRAQRDCDYDVVTDDGTVRAHRDILTAASAAFDTEINSIRLRDTDAATALRLIETVYAQTVVCKPRSLDGIHNAPLSDERDRRDDGDLIAPPLRSFTDVFALLRAADATELNALFSFLCLILPFTLTADHTLALSIVICWCQYVEERMEAPETHNTASARTKLKAETVYRLKREFSGILRRRGRDVVTTVLPAMNARAESMKRGRWRFADEVAAVVAERNRIATDALSAAHSAAATDDAHREHNITDDIAAAACSCNFFRWKTDQGPAQMGELV